MKKILIPTLILLAVLIGSIVYGVSYNFERVQYDKDVLAHLIHAQEEGELIAEYNGVTTKVIGSNLTRAGKVVGVSDREKLYRMPEYDEDKAVILKFSDGAEYIIALDESKNDAVYIIYKYNRKKLYYSVSGYRSFEWITTAVSPDGINSPNEVIE